MPLLAQAPSLRRPPMVHGAPALGSALSLLRDPVRFHVDAYRRHGPVYRFRLLRQEVVGLAGPEAVRFMEEGGDAVVSAREAWREFMAAAGAGVGLVSADGEEHARLRDLMRSGYSARVLNGRYEEVTLLTRHALMRLPTDQPVPVVHLLRQLICEQLGLLAVGRLPGDLFDDFLLFVNTLLNVLVAKRWPAVALRRPAYLRARARVEQKARELVCQHRERGPGERRTLVDDLVESFDGDDSPLRTEGDLIMAVLGPYLAGMDTVANTCAFALHALHRDDALLARVRDEVDATFAAGPLSPQAIRGMPALRGTLMETLRRYPVAPALPRVAARTFHFHGYDVPGGAPLQVATVVGHMLPELYRDPERFDIDRFSAPRNEHLAPGAFAPFGAGAHKCLGRALGELQMTVLLATILHTVELRHVGPVGEPRLSLEPFPTPGAAFHLRLVAHRSAA